MTYEYECLKCHRTFEVEQRITDRPFVACVFVNPRQDCNGEVKRLVSSPAFMLKGKGWAKDGY